jgi:hypothetical protein
MLLNLMWAVGIMGCRNNDLTPFIPSLSVLIVIRDNDIISTELVFAGGSSSDTSGYFSAGNIY